MENNKPTIFTLCIIHDHPKVLLGLKKKKIGAGLWNGFGGRVEDGETVEEAAIREVKEEIGIDVEDLERIGINTFHISIEPYDLEVHIFKSKRFSGELIETEEMGLPKWFHIDEIPYEKMWEDDKYWLPLFIQGKKFKGEYHFDEHNKITKSDLKLTDNF